MRVALIASAALLSLAQPLHARVQSAGELAVIDSQTVALADWKGQEIHLIIVPTGEADAIGKPFNIGDLDARIAAALSVAASDLRLLDMKALPGTGTVVVSVEAGAAGREQPALLLVRPNGEVTPIDLRTAVQRSARISDVPADGDEFWNDTPARALSVTAMRYHDGRLYVAGLGSGSFASTLRVYDLTSDSGPRVTSVEMYHAVHNQIETRAPIRTMAIVDVDGVSTLIAAYTCTPLVAIPLTELRDGAHVTGKTIAELGWGNAPVDMVQFSVADEQFLLLTNTHKAADLMTVAAISEGARAPGITTPITFPTAPLKGVPAAPIPIASTDQLDDLDDQFLIAMRRRPDDGRVQLTTLPKGAYLRLSDFVNEYDFADYRYPPTDAFRPLHAQLREAEGYPELAERSREQ